MPNDSQSDRLREHNFGKAPVRPNIGYPIHVLISEFAFLTGIRQEHDLNSAEKFTSNNLETHTEERRLKAISKQTWPDDTDPHRAQRELRLEALRDDLDRMEAEIMAQRRDLAHKKGRLRPLAVRELAEIANMKTEYEIAYSHLCETTHSSARYLDEMVAYDEAGDFGGFQYQQSKQLLLVYCFTAAELHLDNLTRTVEILQLTLPPELDQLKETHRNLEEQLRRRD